MWVTGFWALISHWRRKPLQLLTLVTGLALATALWSGVQAINAQARASYDAAARSLGEVQLPQLIAQQGDSFDQGLYIALRRAGWQVSPVLEGRLDIAGQSYRLVGVDPLTAPEGMVPVAPAAAPDLTGFFTPPGQIFAAPETAGKLNGLATPVLVSDALAPGLLLSDIGIAQTLLNQPNRLSRLLVLPDQPRVQAPLTDIAPTLQLRAPQSGSDIAALTESFLLNLTAFGLLSFAVGLFIVHGAIGLAFEQRRAVFRTLRALGLPLHVLVTLIALELLALALLAGAIGMVLGYGIAAALLPDVAATLRGLYGAEVSGTLSLRASWWGAGMAIAVLGTAVAAAGAIWRVIRLPLLTPAQPRAWARAGEDRLWVLCAAAAALCALALAAWLLGTGLIAAFVLLGALLVAAALMLPVLLHLLLGLAAGLARGPLAQWFWADTRQQLPGLSLALMALLLALAANIGVSTMVSSFRLTFTGWLDQRLVSELYVTAGSDTQGSDLQAFLTPRADAVLPIWHLRTRVAGLPAQIYGVADHPTYRQNWPLLDAAPNAWDRVASGSGVLINEQLARRQALWVGDAIDLPGGWRADIAGVYSDYGNPEAQVLIGIAPLLRRYPQVEKRQFGVRIAPDLAPGLARALRDDFGLPADSIVDQAAIKAMSLQVFERTFTVTAALNVLTLSIAGFAILTSLLTLAAIRQPQLAPVWVLGLTRRRLAMLELARALMLALLTVLAAIPVGLLLAWLLLAVVNVEAFGWRLPMYLFPWDWIRLSALSLLAAVLAALWPARKLASTPPADLLKVFANER